MKRQDLNIGDAVDLSPADLVTEGTPRILFYIESNWFASPSNYVYYFIDGFGVIREEQYIMLEFDSRWVKV